MAVPRLIILRVSISIHAPARGATDVLGRQEVQTEYFNSRPCERGDWVSILDETIGEPISIHAPARGATWTQRFRRLHRRYFNSRPCERGDVSVWRRGTDAPDFNSRPCERGDDAVERHYTHSLFQFTPLREGRRNEEVGGKKDSKISIHAPARGATALISALTTPTGISIHAPARGATKYLTSKKYQGEFQFTPLREGRPAAEAKPR